MCIRDRDKIHPKVGMKKFVYSLPSFIQPKPEKFAMILEISSEGEILQSLFDSKGKSVTEAGGAVVSYVSKSKL